MFDRNLVLIVKLLRILVGFHVMILKLPKGRYHFYNSLDIFSMPNGLNTQNVNDISQDDHGSTRNMHNGKNHHRYKRSNFKFPFRDEQIPPGLLNNKLLKSLYQSNINTSYFDNDSNEEFNSNKDNDSWGDAINTLADDPEEIDVMHDSPGYGRRESYDENDSDDNDSYDSTNRDTLLNLEKWDMYDSINQIYLELGKSGKTIHTLRFCTV